MRTLNKLLASAMALVVPLCTWAQTEIEPNDGSGPATVLTYNTPMSGSTGACSPTNNSVDYFRAIVTNQGQFRVQSTMSNTGPTDLEVTFQVRQASTAVIGTYSLTAGANGVPVSDSFQFICAGGSGTYFITIVNPSTTVCTNYTFTYDFVAPYFANDPEPNNGGGSSVPVAVNTWREGQTDFYYGDNADYFRLDLPTNGVLNIEWEAEHAGATTGATATITLRQSSTAAIQTFTVPVGANSIPAADLASITCRSNTDYYIISISTGICGTSYRFRYNVTAPVFGNDPEPNNGSGTAVPVAHNALQEGQINFLTYNENADYYQLTLPTDGVLAITMEMEHVGTDVNATATIVLRQAGSAVMETYTVPVGANSTPTTTILTRSCLGNTSGYLVSIVSNVCGASYRWSYNVTAPVFANDVEPNNTQFEVQTYYLDSVSLEGHLGFFYNGSNDGYRFLHLGDSLLLDMSFEHAGAGPGQVLLEVRNTPFSALLDDTLLVVGGGSLPIRDTIFLGIYPPAVYRFNLEPVTCGVSYKYHCNDDDNDGICNAFDDCPNTPAGQGVNPDGCSCTQVTVDDGDPCTLDACLNGIVTNTFQDSDGDGTCDANDGCPNDPNKIAPGICGCGVSDADTDGDLTADCNDGCPNDPNKIAPGICGCGVSDADTDGDLTADCNDPCPLLPNLVNGNACDDGNANTENDVVTNCVCAGTPIGGGCTLNELMLLIQGDGVSNVGWTVFAQGGAPVASGGQVYPNGEFMQSLCIADGCYYLVVTDGGGDGIAGGGYLLRVINGPRIIDNRGNFSSGSTSAILNNGGFCLPLGNDRLITASCDRLELRRGATAACSDRLTADNAPNGTSGNVYQFWFYDPNGTLSLVHPSANGATSNQVSMHNLSSLVEGRLYNVRVRTRISPGVWREWGPACRMRIDNTAGQCASTGLQDDVSNSHLSCGTTKPLGSSAASLVYARPVSRFTAGCGTQNANKYQFRFRIPAEGVVVVKSGVGGNPWTYLNMANVVGSPAPSGAVLEACSAYQVEVRASFDGGLTWCRGGDPYADLVPWGNVCDLFTAGCEIGEMQAEGAINGALIAERNSTMILYPNPNRGDQLFINMSDVPEGIGRVSVELHNMQGQRVMSTTLAAADGLVSGALSLEGGPGAGMYLVSVTVGDWTLTERLVVQP